MKKLKSLYHGHRFPASIISQAVRWYFRFQLSLRNIEELLFERGVIVRHESIRRWVDRFGACFAHCVKAAAKRIFKRVLAACPEVPKKIVIGQLRSCPATKAGLPELAKVRRIFVKASAHVNNRAENSH
jgi:putative transposase